MGYDTLTPGKQYAIVVGESGQFDTSTDLLVINGNNYELTSQNTGQGTNSDLNDSDAYLVNDNTKIYNGYPVDTITIGSVGFVDHSLDFGFRPESDDPPTTTPTPNPTSPCIQKVCLPVKVTINKE